MPTGFTLEPRDCSICQTALALPRKISQKYHEGCDVQAALLYNKSRWQHMTEAERQSNNKRRAQITKDRKKLVFQHYGEQCACCGEATPEFLCIDHINGGGLAHRREIGVGHHFYKWLIDHNFPDGFRTLCHNCNMARGFYGYCPHETLPR